MQMGEEGLEPSQGGTSPDFESGASAIPPLAQKSGVILNSNSQNVKHNLKHRVKIQLLVVLSTGLHNKWINFHGLRPPPQYENFFLKKFS